MGVTLPRGFEREKFDHASLMAMEDDSCVRLPRFSAAPSRTGPLPGGIYFLYVSLCPHLSPFLVPTHQPSEIHTAALLCLLGQIGNRSQSAEPVWFGPAVKRGNRGHGCRLPQP